MSGGHLDMPEHFAAGLKPHSVSEKYYFARGPQLVNRVVDIGPTFETKLACLRACRTMVTHMIKRPGTPLLLSGSCACQRYLEPTAPPSMSSRK